MATIVSIDASSTCTGWAWLSLEGKILQAGILKPDKLRTEPHFRISRMCEDLRQLLNEFQPNTVIIEITSGKVGTNRHKGAGAGLGVYGIAVGAMWQITESWLRGLPAEQQAQTEIVLVTENEWTRGVPKMDRLAAVAAEFSEYNPGQDPGGDLGDALALAVWWLREYRVHLTESVV